MCCHGQLKGNRRLAKTILLNLNYQNIINIESGKRGGRPTIRGMRITVSDVLGWLAAGMTHEEIISDYPELTEKDICACLVYAADRNSRQPAA